jgi:hypothetical protein
VRDYASLRPIERQVGERGRILDWLYVREDGHVGQPGASTSSARSWPRYAGTEVVEFSPTKKLGETMEVVTKNMEEMEASA